MVEDPGFRWHKHVAIVIASTLTLMCAVRWPAFFFPTGTAWLITLIGLALLTVSVAFAEWLHRLRYSSHVVYFVKITLCLQIWAICVAWAYQAIPAVFAPWRIWTFTMVYLAWAGLKWTHDDKNKDFSDGDLNGSVSLIGAGIAFSAGLASFNVYVRLLSEVLFKNEISELSEFGEVFTVGFMKPAGSIAISAILLGLVGGLIWLAIWLFKSRRGTEKRQLTAREKRLRRDVADVVLQELSERQQDYRSAIIIGLAIVGMGLSMVGGAMLAIAADSAVREWFANQRTSGLDWFIYHDDIGVSVFAFCFAGASGGLAVLVWLLSLNRYAMMAGYSGTQAAPNMPFLSMTIASKIRSGELQNPGSMSAEAIVRSTHQAMGQLMALIACVFTGLALLLSIPDRFQYALITKERVVYSDWLHLNAADISMSDVDHIILECQKNDDGDLSVVYRIGKSTFSGAVLVDSLQEVRSPDAQTLNDWEEIHVRILQNDPVISHPIAFLSGRSEYNEQECRSGIVNGFGPDAEARLLRILLPVTE